MKKLFIFFGLLFLINFTIYAGALTTKARLKKVTSWIYQIQGLDTDEAIKKLASTDYPLLVIEPNFTHRDMGNFDVKKMLTTLRSRPNTKQRIILAYIDIGQAEKWRSYWKKEWISPTEKRKGYPEFLVSVDPDGWEDCYPVAYWMESWKKIWAGKSGLIKKIAEFGFDGVYLDWVEAYDDETVKKRAKMDNVDPAIEMIKFVEEIGNSGKKVNEEFLVIPQNAPFLIDFDPDRYIKVIDGLAVEDTWFYGKADSKWDSPFAGDFKTEYGSTKSRLKQYRKFLNNGIPVFSVDYCVKKSNAKFVYKEALKYGLIPLVTRVSLSKITQTPQ